LPAIPAVVSSLIDAAVRGGIEVAATTGSLANRAEQLGATRSVASADRSFRPLVGI
jgi:hypothetical protein